MTLKITMELGLEPGFDQSAFQTLMASAAVLGQQGHPAGAGMLSVGNIATRGGTAEFNTTALVQAGPGVGMNAASEPYDPDALDTGPETAEERMAADAAEEAARTAGTEPAKRRPRRTKAEIEADNIAATRRTLEAAAASGMVPGVAPVQTVAPPPVSAAVPPVAVPPTAPVAVAPPVVVAPAAVPPTAPVAPSIAVPPGAAPQVAAPPAAAIPPAAPVVAPQAPSMPAAPPPGGPMTVATIREAIRQVNMTHPGTPFRIQKANGWFTPEMIPADRYDWFLEELQNAMAATPAVTA